MEDAAKNGTLTGEMVLNSFSNPQESKTVLRFFEKELEKCHKSNDLQGALKLIVVMADSGITFGLFKPDGNTVYNPAIGARDSFREWIYTETYTHGKSIPTEYAREQDRWSPSTYTYEVYGFKISFEKYKSGTLVCNVYTSSKGWYQIGYVHKDDSVYASVD